MGEVTSDWLGTPAACVYLGITLRTLYRLIDDGEIVAYKLGRVLRIRRTDLDDYLEASLVRPGTLRHLYPHLDSEVEDYDKLDDDGDGSGE